MCVWGGDTIYIEYKPRILTHNFKIPISDEGQFFLTHLRLTVGSLEPLFIFIFPMAASQGPLQHMANVRELLVWQSGTEGIDSREVQF